MTATTGEQQAVPQQSGVLGNPVLMYALFGAMTVANGGSWYVQHDAAKAITSQQQSATAELADELRAQRISNAELKAALGALQEWRHDIQTLLASETAERRELERRVIELEVQLKAHVAALRR